MSRKRRPFVELTPTFGLLFRDAAHTRKQFLTENKPASVRGGPPPIRFPASPLPYTGVRPPIEAAEQISFFTLDCFQEVEKYGQARSREV
jgi:hypothetical protein